MTFAKRRSFSQVHLPLSTISEQYLKYLNYVLFDVQKQRERIVILVYSIIIAIQKPGLFELDS